jgi:hypothetical protein
VSSAVIGSCPLLACSSGTAPEPVRPQLLQLEVRAFEAPTGPMILVQGTALDSISEGAYLTATLVLDGEVAAEIRLSRMVCGNQPTALRICRQLLVMLHPGRTAGDLHAFLASRDAAFRTTYTLDDMQAGSIEVFSPAR